MSTSIADSYKGSHSLGHSLGEKDNGDVAPVVSANDSPLLEYRLYKWRWVGLLGVCLLNFIAGAGWLWFSSIAIPILYRGTRAASEVFGISLEQINWLASCVNVASIPVSLVIPNICSHYGLRISCFIGVAWITVGGWIRYAGTTPSLSPDEKFTLMLLGQILLGIGQPWFLIIGPKYSEAWFDLSGRTTATMLVYISSTVGTAFGQVVAPYCTSVRFSVLVLAIMTTGLAPSALLVYSAPLSPPTFAGSHLSPSPIQTLRAFLGRAYPGEITMTLRERVDSIIVCLTFGLLGGALNTLGVVLAQVVAPFGYTPEDAGIMGAVFVLSGAIGAMVMTPLLDRYLTHRLAIASKIITTMIGACFISLIWAIREDNDPGIYTTSVLLGIGCFTVIPILLEIACEVTRNPETSSAVLWLSAYLFTTVFIPVVGRLRDDSPTASPPSNMRGGLIFQAGIASSCIVLIMGLKGKQTRRELDMQKQQEVAQRSVGI